MKTSEKRRRRARRTKRDDDDGDDDDDDDSCSSGGQSGQSSRRSLDAVLGEKSQVERAVWTWVGCKGWRRRRSRLESRPCELGVYGHTAGKLQSSAISGMCVLVF